MLKACHCNHAFQDKTYGFGVRVHTEGKKGEERCTVCGPKSADEQRMISHGLQHKPEIHNYQK